MSTKSLENWISEFKTDTKESAEPCLSMIAVRLPPSYKLSYDEIQKSSDKKLSKLLTKLTMEIIDSVKE
jgi:hypothetical protein